MKKTLNLIIAAAIAAAFSACESTPNDTEPVTDQIVEKENSNCSITNVKFPDDDKFCNDVQETLTEVITEDFTFEKNEKGLEALAAQYDLSNGSSDGKNIWLEIGNPVKLHIIEKKGTTIETFGSNEFDLSKTKVQLWIGDKDGLKWTTKSAGWSGNDKITVPNITTKTNYDLKIFKLAPTTQDFAIIGIDDARGVHNQSSKKHDADFVALDYHSLNRKRVRIWQEGGNLIIQANKETKTSETTLTQEQIIEHEKVMYWGKFNVKMPL